MKFRYILVSATILLLTSCVNKSTLPENPKDKQEYVDKNGNRWIYDYALMRWMMTPIGGSPYYFYPSSGRWTNTSGTTVSQPTSVHSATIPSKASSTTNSSSRPTNTGHSFGSSHPSSHGS